MMQGMICKLLTFLKSRSDEYFHRLLRLLPRILLQPSKRLMLCSAIQMPAYG